MPKLVLIRDHPADIAHRYAIMSLDGKKVATMKFKDRVELEVQPGRHTLEGKNEVGMKKVIEIVAVEGETTTVHIGGISIGCISVFAGLLPPTPTIVMQVNQPWQKDSASNWKE